MERYEKRLAHCRNIALVDTWPSDEFAYIMELMSYQRTVWFLSKEQLGPIRMSPAIRLLEMAHAACSAGLRARLCIAGGAEHIKGLETSSFSTFQSEWSPGDAVVVDAYLPSGQIWTLLQRGIPYDLDLYCTSAPESSQRPNTLPTWRTALARRRHQLAYALAITHAERVYVSTAEQIPMLAATLYYSPYPAAAKAAAHLPAKTLILPMGVPEFSEALPGNPYPPEWGKRPVFLWGGGIWDWFDTETLLQAFAGLPGSDWDPVLFFLSPSNHRGRTSADTPAHRVMKRAHELGILGKSVFFNQKSATPEELPGYVFHATAGIMANPSSWEAGISWRTRYLDLLAAGKPLVVAGSDPLAQRMAQVGAAILVPSGDVKALRVALFSTQDQLASLSKQSRSLSQALSWKCVLAPWIERLLDSRTFHQSSFVPSACWGLRQKIGF